MTLIASIHDFLDHFGPIMNREELAMALVNLMNDRLINYARNTNTQVNCVIGFHWDMQYTDHIIDQSSLKIDGYTGKCWFRLENELAGYPRINPVTLLQDSGYVLGSGGYSTWYGPWQQAGIQFNRWETGVQHNLRTRSMAAYAFTCHFSIADFPGLDQTMLMDKLEDQPIMAQSIFTWEKYDLADADARYIDYLKSL